MDNTIRSLQLVELEILKEFLRICKKHRLRYFALGGTLLGAVRHKGFIPWDDDIDIGMPRPDFIRFERIVEKELPEGMRYHSFRKDPGYGRYVPRLSDERVRVVDTSAALNKTQGAWIDIFPLDGMPGEEQLRKLHCLRLLIARARVNYSRFSTNVDLKRKDRPLMEKLLIAAGRILPVEKIFRTEKELDRLDRLMQKYDYDRSPWMINFMGIHKLKEMFEKKRYRKGVFLPFEDVKLRCPVDTDFVLRQMYGNYMEPPSREEMNHHHTRILDDEQRTSVKEEKREGSLPYSVLMSVYQKEKPEYLEQSIRSMEKQTLPFTELVLVCDGPLTDGLWKVIEEAKARLGRRMQLLKLPENVGLGSALRLGVCACLCPVIARMDSDDISRPARCEKEMEKIAAGYDLVGAAIQEFRKTPRDLERYRVLPSTEEEILAFAQKRNPFNHATVMYRKEAVMEAGNYQAFPGFEDYCLWVRMLLSGAKVVNLPEALLDVRIGNGVSRRRGGKEYIRTVVSFQKYLRDRGFIDNARYLQNCTVRVLVGFIPSDARDWFYRVFLRKGSDIKSGGRDKG